MTRTFIALAAGLGAASMAVAMTELDTDGDQMLTFEELQTAYPEVTEEAFITADADADGMLNEAELGEARAAGIIPEQG